jgi:hypothetical protein
MTSGDYYEDYDDPQGLVQSLHQQSADKDREIAQLKEQLKSLGGTVRPSTPEEISAAEERVRNAKSKDELHEAMQQAGLTIGESGGMHRRR